ncbi:high-affinity methionine permease [[Candida] jaroonii]|uniref:High-affinity methionine permease n=1 Tax=[Candida] jaroonii TaxID=467808 RepID=A0ACA9Y9V9_9ASCO|nr:high-affinity methionine permease [[Candida] jaroonii]
MAKISSLSAMSLIVNKMIGTGIFSTPSIIFQYCGGNISLYLLLWVLGSLVIGCGMIIYLEYSLNLPIRNGGEKNYLQKVYHPRFIGFVYSFQIVLLGFSSGNSYAFGKYVLFSIFGDQQFNDSYVKLIGVGCISFCCYLHIVHHKQSNLFFNILGISKILILMLIIFCGALVWLGIIEVPRSGNFTNMLESQYETNYYSISVALLEIIYSFKGWENANYVLSETSNPYKVLTRSAPLAVVVTTLLYFLVILSYLVVIPKTEIMSSGVLIAGIFFNKIFGETITSKILPLFISVSNFGNVLAVSYAHSMVNKELALENLVPFSSYFQHFNWSMFLHWLVTVVVLVAPPSTEIYEFVVNLYIYPGTWINILLTLGLIYLKLKDDSWNTEELTSLLSPKPRIRFSTPWVCIITFLAANLFMALFPFVKPPIASVIPYWCFPVIGTGVLVLGGVYYFIEKLF